MATNIGKIGSVIQSYLQQANKPSAIQPTTPTTGSTIGSGLSAIGNLAGKILGTAATPALCTVIDVEHTGTIDDPIPAVAGMEYEYGKYYIDGKTIYICQRTGEAAGGKIILYYLPSQLVGQYFEIV